MEVFGGGKETKVVNNIALKTCTFISIFCFNILMAYSVFCGIICLSRPIIRKMQVRYFCNLKEIC